MKKSIDFITSKGNNIRGGMKMAETGNTRQRNLLTVLYALDAAGEATAAFLAELARLRRK